MGSNCLAWECASIPACSYDGKDMDIDDGKASLKLFRFALIQGQLWGLLVHDAGTEASALAAQVVLA